MIRQNSGVPPTVQDVDVARQPPEQRSEQREPLSAQPRAARLSGFLLSATS
jgi:hypothetical protein